MSEQVTTQSRRSTVGLVTFAFAFLAVVGITVTLILATPAPDPIRPVPAALPSNGQPSRGQPSTSGRPPVGPSVTIELTGRLGWLPTRISTDQRAPVLPEAAVGPAAAVIGSRVSGNVLLMPNGSTYELPSGPNGLSPDGRWLVTARDERTVVRDLTRGSVHDVGGARGFGAAVWSPDGRKLALDAAVPSDVYRDAFPSSQRFVSGGVTLVDLSNGQQTSVSLSAYPNARLAGLDDDGVLVIWQGDPEGHTIGFWKIDSATGQELAHASLDLTTVLTSSERESDALRSTSLTPAMPYVGTTVLLWTTGYDKGIMYPGELLAVDLAHGLDVTRLHLPFVAPQQVPAPQGGVYFHGEEIWHYLSTVPEGILLGHDGDAFLAIELLDPTSGKRTVVSTVDDRDAVIHPRGAALLGTA